MSENFYDNFYELNYDWSPTDLTMRQEEDLYNDRGLLTGEVTPDEPVVFLHHLGRWPRDYISSSGDVVFWSDRVVKALQSAGVTGFRTYPVVLYDLHGREIPGYHGIAVTGRSDVVDFRKSKKVTLPPVVEGGRKIKRLKGAYFSPESWDGSDIFSPGGGGAFFATEKVKKIIEGLKKTNIYFLPLNEVLSDPLILELQIERGGR